MVTVVLLVALRLALGCHFLYEGVWKIKHRDEFPAEAGVLGAGEGADGGVVLRHGARHRRPRAAASRLEDGQRRQRASEQVDGQAAGRAGRRSASSSSTLSSASAKSKDKETTHDRAGKGRRQRPTTTIRRRWRTYLTDEWDDIQAPFRRPGPLREGAEPRTLQDAAFQKQRRWDEMLKLRGEAKEWMTELRQPRATSTSAPCSAGRAERAEGRVPAGQLESLCLEPHGADQFRRDLRADGHRVVPDAGALHAAGGLGRGGLHVLRGDDPAGVSRHLSARSGRGRATPCW